MTVISEAQKNVYRKKLEQFGEVFSNSWKSNYFQLDSGEVSSHFELYASENIELFKVITGKQGLVGKLQTPKDRVCFCFQAHESQTILVNNHVLNYDQIFIAPPSSNLDIRVAGNNHYFTLCVKTDFIKHNLKMGQLLARCSSVLSLPIVEANLLVCSIQNMRWLWESKAFENDGLALSEFQIVLLLTMLAQPGKIRRFDEFKWRESSKKSFVAESVISSSMYAMNVKELADNLSIHERTLRQNFKQLYGVSIKQYSKIILLNKARASIVKDPHLPITHHALSNGFEELGRFSADYQRFFGELPKHTRKRQLDMQAS